MGIVKTVISEDMSKKAIYSCMCIKLITGKESQSELKNQGFSLVEIVVVIAVMAILVSLSLPYFMSYIEKTKEKVCKANCLQLERMYHTNLITIEIDLHSDTIFSGYMQEYGKNICPGNGDISYVDGRVLCSICVREEDVNDDGDVPFL